MATTAAVNLVDGEAQRRLRNRHACISLTCLSLNNIITTAHKKGTVEMNQKFRHFTQK